MSTGATAIPLQQLTNNLCASEGSTFLSSEGAEDDPDINLHDDHYHTSYFSRTSISMASKTSSSSNPLISQNLYASRTQTITPPLDSPQRAAVQGMEAAMAEPLRLSLSTPLPSPPHLPSSSSSACSSFLDVNLKICPSSTLPIEHNFVVSASKKERMLNVLKSALALSSSSVGLECRERVPLTFAMNGASQPGTILIADLAVVDPNSPLDSPRVYFVVNCETTLDEFALVMMAASLTTHSDKKQKGEERKDDATKNSGLQNCNCQRAKVDRAYGATICWKRQPVKGSQTYLFLPFEISVFSMPFASARAQAIESQDSSEIDALNRAGKNMSIREFAFPTTYRSRTEFAALLVDTLDQAMAAIA